MSGRRSNLFSHRFRAMVVWATMPVALWTAAPVACCCPAGQCPALNAALAVWAPRLATHCHGCGCHKQSNQGCCASVARGCPRPGKCICPIMSRSPAVIAQMASVGSWIISPHWIFAVAAPKSASGDFSALAAQPSGRCDTGPPSNLPAGFERLLI